MVVGPGVRLGPRATLLPHVVIYAGVQAGSRLLVHAHAVVREGCVLGDDVTLENGAIVGADGFGFAKNEAGHWEKIPQSGPVRLGDRVDVQANACIDRATVGATEIGDGTKVDNLVQVGHGSRVGQNTLFCAQAGLAGSSVVGNNAILAGQAGVAGHCSLGDGAILTAQSGVSHDVPPGKTVSGSAGLHNRLWPRAVAISSARRRCSSVSTESRSGSPPSPPQARPESRPRRMKLHASILIALPALVIAAGCHSYHVETTVENRTGGPVELLEVDYPNASFGADKLATGADYRYRFQITGTGPLKVQFTDASGHTAQLNGPTVAEHQEGSLEIVLLPGGKAEFHPQLSSPQ